MRADWLFSPGRRFAAGFLASSLGLLFVTAVDGGLRGAAPSSWLAVAPGAAARVGIFFGLISLACTLASRKIKQPKDGVDLLTRRMSLEAFVGCSMIGIGLAIVAWRLGTSPLAIMPACLSLLLTPLAVHFRVHAGRAFLAAGPGKAQLLGAVVLSALAVGLIVVGQQIAEPLSLFPQGAALLAAILAWTGLPVLFRQQAQVRLGRGFGLALTLVALFVPEFVVTPADDTPGLLGALFRLFA